MSDRQSTPWPMIIPCNLTEHRIEILAKVMFLARFSNHGAGILTYIETPKSASHVGKYISTASPSWVMD